MSAVEVVLVDRKSKKPGAAFGGHMLLVGLLALLGGVELMFLLPLAHEVLGTPPLHPGYWRCALLAFLIRGLYGSLFRPTRPTASS